MKFVARASFSCLRTSARATLSQGPAGSKLPVCCLLHFIFFFEYSVYPVLVQLAGITL